METAQPQRVLLIEDNRADAVLLQELLLSEAAGRFVMVWEQRLAQGLARLAHEAFDAVLLDLTLPDSAGLATLDRVHAARDAVPIIVVTGMEDEELAMRAIRQGAQDYLVKGALSGRAIARCIRYAIDRLGAERAVREAERRELEARAAARASQSARDIIQAMPEGVLLLSRSGYVLSVNPALEQLSGYRPTEVLGRTLADLLPDLLGAGPLLDRARRDLAALQRGAVPELVPFTLRARDGRQVPVVPSAALIHGPDGAPESIVITLHDIASLRRAQQALEESERKYRELVENANSIILRITPAHDITFFNEYAQRFFGFTAAEVLGRNVVGTIVPPVDAAGRDLRAMVREITTQPEAHSSNENENVCKDGRRVWVHWANRAIRDAQGRVVEILCVGTDITQRKAMEAEALRYQERLHALAERLAVSEEHERWQISRYIHDTIIQNLSLASMRLGTAQQTLAEPSATLEAAHLQMTRKLVDDAIAECRTVMSDLTPPLLYDLGLVPALQDLADKLRQKHGVPIAVASEREFQSPDRELLGLLFQSTRELVMNALKHGAPRQVDVAVTDAGDAVLVRVQDDGRGFDPACPGKAGGKTGGGFGLFSIRERIEGMGGCLEIASAPGQGTTAVISLPVAQPDRTG